MNNQHSPELLQNILTHTSSLEAIIKNQNQHILQILQKQNTFDKRLNHIELKIDKLIKKKSVDRSSLGVTEYYETQSRNFKKDDKVLLNCQTASQISNARSENAIKGRKKMFSLTKQLIGSKVMLVVNDKNASIKHFEVKQQKVKAKLNGWYQLLMARQLDMEKRQFFEIKLTNITNKYLMVGIVNADRIKATTSYDSGQAIALFLWNNHIYSKFGKEKRVVSSEVQNGDLIKVQIEGDQIKWWVGRNFLGGTFIPPEFKLCTLVPYIELYNQGDEIQLR